MNEIGYDMSHLMEDSKRKRDALAKYLKASLGNAYDKQNFYKSLYSSEYYKNLSNDEKCELRIIVNISLVMHETNKFSKTGLDRDEIFSAGLQGLTKAAKTFDETKDIKFSTYATVCIDNDIKMFLRSKKRHDNLCYLDEPLSYDDEGNALTLADLLGTDPDELELEILSMDEKEQLLTFVNRLDKRMSTVIKLRYGLEGGMPHTQLEIAMLLNISRTYVSRVEQKGINKLKLLLEKDKIMPATLNSKSKKLK